MTGRSAGVYFPGISLRGGAEDLAIQIARSLARTGYRTMLFTDDSAMDLGEFDANDAVAGSGFSIRRLDTLPKTPVIPAAVDELRTLRRHARQIRKEKLDLFVNAKYKSRLPGCGAANIYYVHFPHALDIPTRGSLHSLYLAAVGALEKLLVDRCRRGFLETYDSVWANSHFTAGHVRTRWYRQAEVLYPLCSPVAPQEKQRLIVSVGRFQWPAPNVPHKSQAALIDAFTQLTDLHAQGWRLVLIGGASKPEQAFVEELSGRVGHAPIEFVVNATGAYRDELLGQASLYWHAQGLAGDARGHPETQEHFGISVVEALSAGTVPLVFGAAGPAEIVSPIAGIEPWQSTEELVAQTRRWAAILQSGEHPVRQSCRDRAEDFAPDLFDSRLSTLLAEIPRRSQKDRSE